MVEKIIEQNTIKKSIVHPFYQLLQQDIERIDKKADKYRYSFYAMRIGLIAITGVITVISGLKVGWDKDRLTNSILVLGAVVTALTSIDTLFQIETKKNIYNLMLVELREIRSAIVYYFESEPDKLDEKIKDQLFPKYQTIMNYSKTLIEKRDKNTSPTHPAKPNHDNTNTTK